MAYLDYHRTVIGYHGTSAKVADALVEGEPFKVSTSISEWLGSVIYFWEYAPKQAWWWEKKFTKNSDPAVRKKGPPTFRSPTNNPQPRHRRGW